MDVFVESDRKEAELDLLREGMREHTTRHLPWEEYEDLTIALRDEEGHFRGAALGETGRGWLHVSVIWVEEDLRGRGYGANLLAALEGEAIGKGAGQAFLDTFSYQARPFYEKNGYEVFGTLEDYPPGHRRFFMRKRLV